MRAMVIAVLALAFLVDSADGQQQRLTDEECYDLSIAEGAAAFRALTGRETEEDRQVATLRRALGISRRGTPEECRNRPTPESRRFKPQLRITEEEADRRVHRANENAGAPDAKCTKKPYGTGWATVCE